MSTDTLTRIDIRPLPGTFAAEVLELDLSQPLADDDFRRIHQAHLDHHVLVFRDQHITPQQQEYVVAVLAAALGG